MASSSVIPCLYNSFSFTTENISDTIVFYSCVKPAPLPQTMTVPVIAPEPVSEPVPVMSQLSESDDVSSDTTESTDTESTDTTDTDTDTDTTESTDTDTTESTDTETVFNPEVMNSHIVTLNASAKDSLLWAIYIMIYGIEKFETIENYYTESNTFKFALVELLRENKAVLKANKLKLNALEETLVHKPFIGLEILQAIAICKHMSVCVVQDRKYYEVANGSGSGSGGEFIIEKIKGKYVLYMSPNRITAGYLKYIRKNYWLMESISAPIRPLSAYKLQDLVDISQKLNLPVVNVTPGKFGSMGTETRKTRPELYEAICKCV
jgi:hypothetical protein